MQRVLAAAHLAVDHLQSLRVCRHCERPLRPLFCVACRQSFCRCCISRHELCEGVRRDEQLSRVLDALGSVAEWAVPSRLPLGDEQPPPNCELRLRVRPPLPTVWLTLRLQPPHQCGPPTSSHKSAVQQMPQNHRSVLDQPQQATKHAHPSFHTSQPQQSRVQATKPRDVTLSPSPPSPIARSRVRAKPPLRRTKRKRVPSRRTQQAAASRAIQSTQPLQLNETNVVPHNDKPISQQTTQPPSQTAPDHPQPTSSNHSQTCSPQDLNRNHGTPQLVNVRQSEALPPTDVRVEQLDLAANTGARRSGDNSTLETHGSTTSSPRETGGAKQLDTRTVKKRPKSRRNAFEERRVTPPVKKRRYIRLADSGSAPITTVVKTTTRLKVSQSAPSENDEQVAEKSETQAEKLVPNVKVSPVTVEQPFVRPSPASKETKNDGSAPLHGDWNTVQEGNSEGNVGNSATNNSKSLCKADNDQGRIGSALRTNEAHPGESRRPPLLATKSKELMQTGDNGEIADDKLSEGTTTPCGREDAYQDDPITPIRDGLDGNDLKRGDELAGGAMKHTVACDWNSRSPKVFISPLTTEKRRQCRLPNSYPLVKAVKPVDGRQIDIASGAFAICLSDFGDDEQYELVFEIITQMGGEPLEHMRGTRPDCLITPLDAKTGAIKSRKMAVHQALAFRVPIVGIRWLLHSFKAGRWMPAEEYDASACFHKGATGIFKGLIATIDELFLEPEVSETVVQFREDIKRLILGAEGVVVDSEQLAERVRGSSRFTLHVHVVKNIEEGRYDASPELAPEKMEALRCIQDKIPVKVINMNWLSDCLFSGQCPPPERSQMHGGCTASPILSR